MTNDNKKQQQPTTANNNNNNIQEVQRQIIESLRNQVQEQEQKIAYLREIQQDYDKLQAQISKNPQLYYQIVQPYDPAEEHRQKLQQQNAILERETQRAEAEENRKQAILKDNPHITNEFKERKARAEASRDMMLEKCTAFYDMTEADAQTYINVPHRPEESAVKHLILEYQEGPDALTVTPKPTVYMCSYCENKFYSLGEFERDAYLSRSDHRDINLKRIEEDYLEEMNNTNKWLEKEIFQAGRDANIAAERKAAENRHAAQQRAKKDLPFVTK